MTLSSDTVTGPAARPGPAPGPDALEDGQAPVTVPASRQAPASRRPAMRIGARVFTGVAALVMLAGLAAPLWHYDFLAPQYPEGLSLSIWAYKLGGRFDLVNELNHYVGMEVIDEAAFPEFRVIPAALVLLALWGMMVAARGGVAALEGWLAAFALAGFAALGDFWLWLYRYGHDLNPRAPIRIAPFTPRLLGSYSLMNFSISGYPGLGASALFAAFLLGAAALVLQARARPGATARWRRPHFAA